MDLLFVFEIDSFQFHDGLFVLKCIVIHPVQAGPPAVYTFETYFLLNEPEDALQTYRYATKNLHGLPMSLPALPYDFRSEAVSPYKIPFKAFQLLEQSVSFGKDNGPSIMILVKGSQKIQLLRDLINATDVLERLEVHNLEDYGCLAAQALTGGRSSTAGRASVLHLAMRPIPQVNSPQSPIHF